jgi:hypothetical protein
MLSPALPFLLCAWLDLYSLALPNLDFRAGTLAGWEGQGFAVLKPDNDSPQPSYAVSSRDEGPSGRKALLHRVITIPTGAGVIHFSACAVSASKATSADKLDVVLLATGKRIIPKHVRTAAGWAPTNSLLPAKDGRARDYIWKVDAFSGHPLRIVLVDEDDSPGAYIHCSGFSIESAASFQEREFKECMTDLSRRHALGEIIRFDSPHFVALSNAEEGFSEARIRNCELLYGLFYDHFRAKGFVIREPGTKLMLALFSSQAGFEAYLGQRMPPTTTGIYHPGSNRFVIYDYGQNESFLREKRRAEQEARRIDSYMDRQRYWGSLNRDAQDFRNGANLRTIMHEAAHHVSFNCGLLNRDGDVPLWLAEGLACYCEPTANGTWQGIGEINPERVASLAGAVGEKTLLSLREILESDRWVKRKRDSRSILLGYAQSWALFRMLIEEQPQALRTYLDLIYTRQTSERRLADFQEAFGTDLVTLEQQYREYIRQLSQR